MIQKNFNAEPQRAERWRELISKTTFISAVGITSQRLLPKTLRAGCDSEKKRPPGCPAAFFPVKKGRAGFCPRSLSCQCFIDVGSSEPSAYDDYDDP
jgi:hypothetical protein